MGTMTANRTSVLAIILVSYLMILQKSKMSRQQGREIIVCMIDTSSSDLCVPAIGEEFAAGHEAAVIRRKE
jgi:hypothetical protein